MILHISILTRLMELFSLVVAQFLTAKTVCLLKIVTFYSKLHRQNTLIILFNLDIYCTNLD